MTQPEYRFDPADAALIADPLPFIRPAPGGTGLTLGMRQLLGRVRPCRRAPSADAPRHTRLRKLVTHALTAKRIADMETRTAWITSGLLYRLADRQRGGQRLPRLLGAANRDPEFAADPESFDITRKELRILSFGELARC